MIEMNKNETQNKDEKHNWIDPKAGYIIEIPNYNSVVINIGAKDNVKVGNKIAIYEEGQELFDPTVKKAIGRFDFIKEIVEVVDVNENFSTCKKLTRSKGNTLTIAVSSILQEKEYMSEETLNVNESDVKDWEIKNPEISIMDPIKIIND